MSAVRCLLFFEAAAIASISTATNPTSLRNVHVDMAGASVKVWLDPVAAARNVGFAPRELAEVVRLVQQSRSALMEAWREFFS